MAHKLELKYFTTIAVTIILLAAFYSLSGMSIVRTPAVCKCSNDSSLLKKVVSQRNELSKLLNQMAQRIGKMECEKKNEEKRRQGTKKKHLTSDTGGWCKNESMEHSAHHHTDKGFANQIAKFLKGKSIGSFGDGPGNYRKLILESGLVKSYDAYDGAPYAEETSHGRVKYLELTLQQFGLPQYDWILSLEVAEHIPKNYETIYVDNLVRHCREGIILSWAIPGQGGDSHVNERPPRYSIEIMSKYGFSHDMESSKILRNSSHLFWFQKNTNVFRRRNITNDKGIDQYYS